VLQCVMSQCMATVRSRFIVCCSVSQCVAVCCSVSCQSAWRLYVAKCFCLLQCVVVYSSVLQCVVLCHVTVHSDCMDQLCCLLQCVAVCHVTVHGDCMLQCVAVCCSVLHCITVCCSLSHHAAITADFMERDFWRGIYSFCTHPCRP